MRRDRSDTPSPRAAQAVTPERWRETEAARWTEIQAEWLRQHPVLTAAEIVERAGRRRVNPSALLKRWVDAGRIFALAQGPRRLYPAFQFGADGQPKAAFQSLLSALDGALDGWPLAVWLTRPNSELRDWATPLDVIADDPDAVVRAARLERQAVSF